MAATTTVRKRFSYVQAVLPPQGAGRVACGSAGAGWLGHRLENIAKGGEGGVHGAYDAGR